MSSAGKLHLEFQTAPIQLLTAGKLDFVKQRRVWVCVCVWRRERNRSVCVWLWERDMHATLALKPRVKSLCISQTQTHRHHTHSQQAGLCCFHLSGISQSVKAVECLNRLWCWQLHLTTRLFIIFSCSHTQTHTNTQPVMSFLSLLNNLSKLISHNIIIGIHEGYACLISDGWISCVMFWY